MQAVESGDPAALLKAGKGVSMCGKYPWAVALSALQQYSTAAAAPAGGERSRAAVADTEVSGGGHQQLEGDVPGRAAGMGFRSSVEGTRVQPELLAYAPAHVMFPRPDSTGFASFVITDDCVEDGVGATLFVSRRFLGCR